jgi:hypothetical protein
MTISVHLVTRVMRLADICARSRTSSCVFCDIAASGACDPRVIHSDDCVVAFDDIDPGSIAHILVRVHECCGCRAAALNSAVIYVFQVIPRLHIPDVSALDDEALRERLKSCVLISLTSCQWGA